MNILFMLFFLQVAAFCGDNAASGGGTLDTCLEHVLGPFHRGTVEHWQSETDDYLKEKVLTAEKFLPLWKEKVWGCLYSVEKKIWGQRWYHDLSKVMNVVQKVCEESDLDEKDLLLPHIQIFIINSILDTRTALHHMGKQNREGRPEKKEMREHIYKHVYEYFGEECPGLPKEDFSWMPTKPSLKKDVGQVAIDKGAGDFCFLNSEKDLEMWLKYCLAHPTTQQYDIAGQKKGDGNLELHFALVEEIFCIKRMHNAGKEYKYMITKSGFFALQGFLWGLPGVMQCTMPEDPSEAYAEGTHYSGFMGLSGNTQHDSVHGNNTINIIEIFDAIFESKDSDEAASNAMLELIKKHQMSLPVTINRAAFTLYSFRGLHDDMSLPFHGEDDSAVLGALKAMFNTERGWAEVNYTPMMKMLDQHSGRDFDKVDEQRWRDADYQPFLEELATKIRFRKPPIISASALLERLGNVCPEVPVALDSAVAREDLAIYVVTRPDKYITSFYDQVHKQLTVCLPDGKKTYDSFDRSLLKAQMTYLEDVLAGKHDVAGPDQYLRLVGAWWSYIGVLFAHTGDWWHSVIYDMIIKAALAREEGKEPLPCCSSHTPALRGVGSLR